MDLLLTEDVAGAGSGTAPFALAGKRTMERVQSDHFHMHRRFQYLFTLFAVDLLAFNTLLLPFNAHRQDGLRSWHSTTGPHCINYMSLSTRSSPDLMSRLIHLQTHADISTRIPAAACAAYDIDPSAASSQPATFRSLEQHRPPHASLVVPR